jgi:N-acetylglucosamine kinase-like BadF-type ATPase
VSSGHLVALDAGNSKTDILLISPDGSVAGYRRQGGFKFSATPDGVTAELDQLVDGIRALLEQCGRPPVSLIEAYLANADFPEQEAHYAEYLGAAGLAGRVVVGNDMTALLRSGASEAVGVAVVCGAGINCIGVGADGRQVRFPALGPLTGDWGGGHSLAKDAMFLACRGEDGRGSHTALSAAIAEHFDTPTAVAAGIALNLNRIPYARVHEVVPLLFQIAARGDQVSVDLVRKQAAEVVAMAKVAIVGLELADRDCEVVLGGGVLAARDQLLMASVTAGLLSICPAARIVVPTQPPVVGAALLGIAKLAGTPAWQRPVDEPTFRNSVAAAMAPFDCSSREGPTDGPRGPG